MYDGTKSFIAGIAKGALKGAGVGMAIMGAAAVATTPFTFGLGMLVPMAFTFILGAMGAVSIGGIAFGAVVMGGALIGAIYKGVSEYVDTEETLTEKDEMVHLAKITNAMKRRQDKELAPRPAYRPENTPKDIPADEMPENWRGNRQDKAELPAPPASLPEGEAVQDEAPPPSVQRETKVPVIAGESYQAESSAPASEVEAEMPGESGKFTSRFASLKNQPLESRFSNTTLSSPSR